MYTIFFADDEPEIRNGLMKYIQWEQIGFRCVGSAANGKEAIDAIMRLKPDVALCDIRMPGLSGLDIAKYVHEYKLPTKVVLLSAHRDFEYARTAMAFGVHYYIIKSTRYAELVETFVKIKHALDEQAAGPEDDDQLLRDIKQYISQNLGTATLESAAESVRRHPSSVSQYFREHAGMLFSQYIIQERMRYAATLLCDVRNRIGDISEMAGYSNQQNFSRTFRQYFGVTPGEYRQSHTNRPTEGL